MNSGYGKSIWRRAFGVSPGGGSGSRPAQAAASGRWHQAGGNVHQLDHAAGLVTKIVNRGPVVSGAAALTKTVNPGVVLPGEVLKSDDKCRGVCEITRRKRQRQLARQLHSSRLSFHQPADLGAPT